jgi:hypothetical protein
MSERTLRLATGALAALGADRRLRDGAELFLRGGARHAGRRSRPRRVRGAIPDGGPPRGVGADRAGDARVTAFMFSAYLLYIQLAVIGAICQWCVVTDVLTTAIAALALLRLQIETEPAPSAVSPARPYPKPRPNRSRPRSKTNQRARR